MTLALALAIITSSESGRLAPEHLNISTHSTFQYWSFHRDLQWISNYWLYYVHVHCSTLQLTMHQGGTCELVLAVFLRSFPNSVWLSLLGLAFVVSRPKRSKLDRFPFFFLRQLLPTLPLSLVGVAINGKRYILGAITFSLQQNNVYKLRDDSYNARKDVLFIWTVDVYLKGWCCIVASV